MMELIALYECTLWAAFLSAPVLAFLGVQLACRDRALQSICVGQGAVAGVLLGLGLATEWGLHECVETYPLISGLIFSALSWQFADVLVRSKNVSKNTYFAALLGGLIALGHLFSSLFPHVENHLAQVYFGDLATLSHSDSILTSIVCVLVLAYFVVFSRSINRNSVDLALYQRRMSLAGNGVETSFQVITLIILCFSVQYLGFLYTIALLFLPTSLMSYCGIKGLYPHIWGSVILASISSVGGLLLSLEFTRMPTVPAIVLVMAVLGALCFGAVHVYGAIVRKPQQYLAPDSVGT